ncbi:MAG: poly-gamma-glutamate hydrolase family protein, partial [Pseudomonadota bacterium]
MAIPKIDRYANFTELSRYEAEGRDYRIHLRRGNYGIVIGAPHGGRIERGTMAIADAIAGGEHTYYCFEGTEPKLKQNRVLHITSDHFDEPCALHAVQSARRVITIHGATGLEPAVFAGGLDLVLRRAVLSAMRDRGIPAADDPSPTRQGRGL